jgi:hypothetical protein
MSIFKTSPLSISNLKQRWAQQDASPPPWAIDLMCVAVLVIYFLHFALPALGGHLNDDEMPELYRYWHYGALKWIWANLCFWTESRPGGVAYYAPLYHLFGLAPEPYRLVQIVILAASIPLLYHLAKSLSASRPVAFLAVLALCYHPRLISLVFVGSFSYDVLCGVFYFVALAYYIHIRETVAHLRPLQMLGFLALYVCALDFKEMAVTLPVIVLIYEFLKTPRWSDWKQFIQWVRSSAVPALVAGLLTVLYIYGRTYGPNATTMWRGYRPHYSWSSFLKSNAHFVSELVYYPGFPTHVMSKAALIALWAFVFLYAFLRRDRALRLMAFWIVIVPLPLAFIGIRSGGHLYLPLFGWAMIFARVAFDVITLISKASILIGQGMGMGAATGAIIGGAATGSVRWAAIGAGAGAAAGRISASTFTIVATFIVASALAIFTERENPPAYVRAFLKVGEKSSHIIEAFRSLNLHPAHGSAILVKGNNLESRLHIVHIASLVWNDHSLRIWLDGQNDLMPQQPANMDYVISLSEFRAEIVRAPESERH